MLTSDIAGLVALLAHSRKADRAVANSLRNFLRILGGSIGLTSTFNPIRSLFFTNDRPVSGTILNNTLKTHLQNTLPPNTVNTITSSAYALSSINLSPGQYEMVMDAYMAGMHTIFVMYAPIIGVCFVCAVLIRDEGVAEKDAKAPAVLPSEKTGGRDMSEGVMINSPPVTRQGQV
jgi:hypothetical protein